MAAESRLSLIVHGRRPNVRRSLSDTVCGVVYARRQSTQQGVDDQRLSSAGQCDRAVDHLLAARVGGSGLEVGQQSADLAEQARPVVTEPAQGDAGLDKCERAQFAAGELIEAVVGDPFFRRRTLQSDTACQ